MTLDEAKSVAKTVLGNTTRSHVRSASELAAFVLSIPDDGVLPIESRIPKRFDLDADEL